MQWNIFYAVKNKVACVIFRLLKYQFGFISICCYRFHNVPNNYFHNFSIIYNRVTTHNKVESNKIGDQFLEHQVLMGHYCLIDGKKLVDSSF